LFFSVLINYGGVAIDLENEEILLMVRKNGICSPKLLRFDAVVCSCKATVLVTLSMFLSLWKSNYVKVVLVASQIVDE